MKHNLKTRFPYKNTYEDYFKKTEKWFEDFEAELQARNDEVTKKELDPKMVSDMETQYWRGYIQRGKEILRNEA